MVGGGPQPDRRPVFTGSISKHYNIGNLPLGQGSPNSGRRSASELLNKHYNVGIYLTNLIFLN